MLWLTIKHCEYKDVKPERIALKKGILFLDSGQRDSRRKANKQRYTFLDFLANLRSIGRIFREKV